MDKQYDHTKYEKLMYQTWEDSGAFTPTVEKGKKPFTIIMPPPNANDPKVGRDITFSQKSQCR
jgi:valyl-tRNA synthetase